MIEWGRKKFSKGEEMKDFSRFKGQFIDAIELHDDGEAMLIVRTEAGDVCMVEVNRESKPHKLEVSEINAEFMRLAVEIAQD